MHPQGPDGAATRVPQPRQRLQDVTSGRPHQHLAVFMTCRAQQQQGGTQVDAHLSWDAKGDHGVYAIDML
jgi:hypothetical protein